MIKGEISYGNLFLSQQEKKLLKIIKEYKETKKALEFGLDWLNEKDYAKRNLDLVNVIIADLEKLSKEV